MHNGIYGCSLKYYSVHEKMMAGKLPCALVMEDDIDIRPILDPRYYKYLCDYQWIIKKQCLPYVFLLITGPA